MSSRADEIRRILEQYPQYQETLFCRGYLVTSRTLENLNAYPFYNQWRKTSCGKLKNGAEINIYCHRWQNCYTYEENGISVTLIGHAYNPFDMKYQEIEIIKDCLNAYEQGKDYFFSKVSELTGIHLIILYDKYGIIAVQDCCGIMPVYYGAINNDFYLASHGQLVGDICGLEMSENIRVFINAPFYKIGIAQLCGLDTPFSELTMLSPNTCINLPDMKVERFYPKNALTTTSVVTSDIERILKNSIRLCTDKWKCSVSLTGGIDSKMTLAAANELYDKLNYFSFISSEAEGKDARAAHEICLNLGLEHTIYTIPENESEIKDFGVIAEIMNHNQGYIRRKTGSDARKRAYLANHADIGLEIKSHVSEVGRAFYYKKLGKRKFRFPLTPRDMSNLAKRNFFNRSILRNMDASYRRFIETTDFGDFPDGYDETDMFYWENRMSAWGALVKQSFDVAHETTIPYNNRKLLELFFSFTLEDRIADVPQKVIIKNLNSKLFNMNISNNNEMKSRKRILLERVFFEVNSKFN
jgi:hypothetical protein